MINAAEDSKTGKGTTLVVPLRKQKATGFSRWGSLS
jgi:hypothetical protein